MRSVLLVFLFTISTNVFAHPLHVSICEIEYNENEKALEIVMSMFTDEMESAVLLENGVRLNLGMVNQNQEADSLMRKYLSKHFSIKVNDQNTSMEYLGSETENLDRVVCYLRIAKINSITSITFFNQVFQELFSDQINMLHLDIYGKKRSTFFSNNNRSQKIEIK